MGAPPEEIVAVLEDGVAGRAFSAAAASWSVDGEGGVAVAGQTRWRGGEPVLPGTSFDVASLTKPFVAAAALRLVGRGELGLGDRLEALLPELEGRDRGRATLEQLLAHEAGFRDWEPFFEGLPLEQRGTAAGRIAIIDAALAAGAAHAPGATALYSDLGFIALAAILERRSGLSLDRLVDREVTGPLGLDSVGYRAVGDPAPAVGVASTEDCPWRGRVLTGEVHDDNTWAMGGVSGHAGLFATAGDLVRFGEAWLGSFDGEGGWLPPELVRRAVRRRLLGRGLGWDLKSASGSSAGERFGADAFGHLGFTGCSLWVDPGRRLAAALLTNRVHPSRENTTIRALRPRFHDVVVGALFGGR